MKHTIEIKGLPEGYEIVDIHVTGSMYGSNGAERLPMIAGIKKKQPRRIVLEEEKELKKADVLVKDRYWRIVEDTGERNDSKI